MTRACDVVRGERDRRSRRPLKRRFLPRSSRPLHAAAHAMALLVAVVGLAVGDGGRRTHRLNMASRGRACAFSFFSLPTSTAASGRGRTLLAVDKNSLEPLALFDSGDSGGGELPGAGRRSGFLWCVDIGGRGPSVPERLRWVFNARAAAAPWS